MLFGKKQQIMICVLAGMLVADFLLFGHMPLHKRLKGIEQTRSAQKLAISKASAQSEQLPMLEEELVRLNSIVGSYERQVPAERALGVFLHRIADLMNGYNLKDQQIQPGVETERENLSCIPISMKCKGKLEQMFGFFESLQNLDRLVRIEQIKLHNDSNFSGEISMQTKAFIYYRADAQQG